MGLCASKKEDVAEPKQMEEKEKKDVSSGDEGSEDEGPEVEGAAPGNNQYGVNENGANNTSKNLQTMDSHPALIFKKKKHLKNYLKKSLEFERHKLPDIVKDAVSKKMLEDMNITFNVYAEHNNGVLGKKEIMSLHGLPLVQRHLKPYHPSQLFADRLHKHYSGKWNDNKDKNVTEIDGITDKAFVKGFSNLHQDINGNQSIDHIFNMYDLSDNKTYISRNDFYEMARSLIASASLAPEFRLISVYYGIDHSSTKHDEEGEAMLDNYVDSIFKGKSQISRKTFVSYINNVENISNMQHTDTNNNKQQEVVSSPVVPSRRNLPRINPPPTLNLNKVDNIEEKEHDRIEQNKNNTNSNEIPHGDTMEEVMRKLEETDVAIKSVHHVPSEMENEYVPDAL